MVAKVCLWLLGCSGVLKSDCFLDHCRAVVSAHQVVVLWFLRSSEFMSVLLVFLICIYGVLDCWNDVSMWLLKCDYESRSL